METTTVVEKIPPVRGPINISTELSESHPVAGVKFTVSVRVDNPFDVDINILALRILVPSGLKFLGKDRGLDARETNSNQSEENVLNSNLDDVNLTDGERIKLAPNDILIHNFHLQTENWLFASTKEYDLNAAVSYIVDGKTHRQALHITFSTRTRISAPIIGATVGSLMGFFSKTFSTGEVSSGDFPAIIFQVLTALIFGIIAVVISVRRLGAQPVITVEDLYGGLILGFLVGYLGTDFFENFYK